MACCNRKSQKLDFVSLNVRSLRANFDELLMYIENKEIKFDVLGITESWIRKEESFAFQIPGYKMIVQERATGQGGGVVLYVKDSLQCNTSEIESEQFNGIQFSISDKNNYTVSGLLIYRFCRTSIPQFLTSLEDLYESLPGHAVIFGDMNINIIPPPTPTMLI